jgi:hypothetical protein
MDGFPTEAVELGENYARAPVKFAVNAEKPFERSWVLIAHANFAESYEKALVRSDVSEGNSGAKSGASCTDPTSGRHSYSRMAQLHDFL